MKFLWVILFVIDNVMSYLCLGCIDTLSYMYLVLLKLINDDQ